MSLTLITGPMMSGKTTEILRRMAIDAGTDFKTMYLNHISDIRSENSQFSSHNPLYKEKMDKMENTSFITIDSLPEFSTFLDIDSIYFDEVQFWKEDKEKVISYILSLVETYNKHVTLAGLSSDHLRRSWGPLLALQPYADNFIQLSSRCYFCASLGKKEKAIFSLKIAGDLEEREQAGGSELYAAVCRKCFLNNRTTGR